LKIVCGGSRGVIPPRLLHAQWGNLKGRILLEGEVPKVKLLVKMGDKTVKDAEVCAAQDIPDESLVVDKDSKGIANVAVWLAKKPEAIHPDLAQPAAKAVTINIKGARFAPHVAVVRTGQTLSCGNVDPIMHNSHSKPLRNVQFNMGLAPNGGMPPFTFHRAEKVPFPVVCDIHPWMQAYVLVVDHPYAAITDNDGNFEIKSLPAGEHELKFWHETAGYLVKDAQNPKRGLIMNIEDGQQMVLDDIKVPLKVFERN
jgi:hypothetical protein